jgi:hypothetical protein
MDNVQPRSISRTSRLIALPLIRRMARPTDRIQTDNSRHSFTNEQTKLLIQHNNDA